jgi:hypothetical protein
MTAISSASAISPDATRCTVSAAAREQLLIALVSAGSTPRETQVVCFGQPGLTGRPRGVTVRAGAVEEVSLVAVELQVSVGAADAAGHSAGGRPWNSRVLGAADQASAAVANAGTAPALAQLLTEAVHWGRSGSRRWPGPGCRLPRGG